MPSRLTRHQRCPWMQTSAFVAQKMENQGPGGGLCPLRRISTRRSTRQDAQINYLSTLSIFMKQTTYLATLPNPNLKANAFLSRTRIHLQSAVRHGLANLYRPGNQSAAVLAALGMGVMLILTVF